MYPLCRLRHATLHPGALLWTPGSGGGNLGAGAEAALDDVCEGGEVVVAFQARAREPLHPQGVLARVELAAPFPDDWDPTGLGASKRYKLRGLRRVTLDLGSLTHRKVPTVCVSEAPGHTDDWMAPPDELVTLLEQLAGADASWPDYWTEAFESLPTATLGQWATTLGWRLGSDDRLTLFERPQKIAEMVQSTLDALQMGLDPARRRAAVRRQTITRRTSAMPERELMVTADEDGWALFHPGDLSEEDAELEVETGLEARMAGHLARGDGVMILTDPGCVVGVRVTAGPVATDESTSKAGEAIFRLDVRHGRLFLGRGGLTTGSHFDDKLEYAEPGQWIDVPHGLFKATVMAFEVAPPEAEAAAGEPAGVDADSAAEPADGGADDARQDGPVEAMPADGGDGGATCDEAPEPEPEPVAPARRYIVRLEAIEGLDEVPSLEARPRI